MFSSKKPFSSVTVAIDNLTSEGFEEDDIGGIPDLVESIRLQATGPTEASRAIRKKLKYGNVHRQLRALTILDSLIKNAGDRFQRSFADEMLLERLRVCGTSDLSDPLVKAKCKTLFLAWQREYSNPKTSNRGLEQIAALSKQLPRRKQQVTQNTSKVLRETEQNPFGPEDEEEPPTPTQPTFQSQPVNHAESSRGTATAAVAALKKATKEKAKKDKKGNKHATGRQFNLAAEKETMNACIADSSVTSTNLLNALRLINRDQEQISDNQAAVAHFEKCKLLRRKILRYIQHVEAEEWLGALLDANDRLVESLMTYEHLDRSFDADSDSDDEMAHQQHLYKMTTGRGANESGAEQLAGLNINASAAAQPPRPVPVPVQEEEENEEIEEDENDPFSDRNAVATPAVERSEPQWK